MSTELSGRSPVSIDTELYPILEQIAKAENTIAGRRRILEERAELPYIRARHEEVIAETEQQLERLEAKAAPLEAEYNDRPWARYIVSVSHNGHLHKRHCHTLTPGRSMVGQVAEASGLDESEVVGKYDVSACTHCFPSAPVEHKPTIAELGLCEHSGEYVPEDRLPDGWHRYAVLPSVKCECGYRGAITKSGKYRKHERGQS